MIHNNGIHRTDAEEEEQLLMPQEPEDNKEAQF